MKNKIDILLIKIGNLMKGYLENQNFSAVTQISPLLSQVQELKKRLNSIENDVLKIESSLEIISGRSLVEPSKEESEIDKFQRQKIQITIDWKINGIDKAQEIIVCHNACDSMVKFLKRLVEEKGDVMLETLSKIVINRGPLLSENPSKDFVNQRKGSIYGHQELPGTKYYVLTHSSTSEKKDCLQRICRDIGLCPESVKIDLIDEKNLLSGLLKQLKNR